MPGGRAKKKQKRKGTHRAREQKEKKRGVVHVTQKKHTENRERNTNEREHPTNAPGHRENHVVLVDHVAHAQTIVHHGVEREALQ